MSEPKEGSRDIKDGIIIAEPMDWCRSPTAIVPYKIWARQQQAADLANTVRQTSDGSHVAGSLVLSCYGDEAGVGGGVHSGTHNAECTPKTWSGCRGRCGKRWEWFVSRLGDVLHESVKATSDELKPLKKGDCEKELQDAVDNVFKGKDMNQLVRSDPRSPKIFQREMDWIMQPSGTTKQIPFSFE